MQPFFEDSGILDAVSVNELEMSERQFGRRWTDKCREDSNRLTVSAGGTRGGEDVDWRESRSELPRKIYSSHD